jgi:DNA-binding transcriptional ArsR family regulator
VSDLEGLAALFDAVGHPARLRILVAIRDSDAGLSPKELAEMLPYTIGTTSYHVRTMEDAGLLKLAHQKPVRGAMQHFYRLTPNGVKLLVSAEALL